MFHHLLVPLDGSLQAEQALPVAVRLAQASRGTITLLQVVDLTEETYYQGACLSSVSPESVGNVLTAFRKSLEQICQRCDLRRVSVQTQVAWGHPAEAILAQAAKLAVDLIVLSSHGYTGVKLWLLGSTAEQIAHRTRIPVLILREPGLQTALSNEKGCLQIRALVPLDAFTRSLDALVPAAEVVTALSDGNGALHLTRIVCCPQETSAAKKEAHVQIASQHLAGLSEDIRDGLLARLDPALHPAITWSVAVASDVARGIILLAEKGEERSPGEVTACNLIALTTHEAGGSTAERVLHLTRLPILIVPRIL